MEQIIKNHGSSEQEVRSPIISKYNTLFEYKSNYLPLNQINIEMNKLSLSDLQTIVLELASSNVLPDDWQNYLQNYKDKSVLIQSLALQAYSSLSIIEKLAEKLFDRGINIYKHESEDSTYDSANTSNLQVDSKSITAINILAGNLTSEQRSYLANWLGLNESDRYNLMNKSISLGNTLSDKLGIVRAVDGLKALAYSSPNLNIMDWLPSVANVLDIKLGSFNINMTKNISTRTELEVDENTIRPGFITPINYNNQQIYGSNNFAGSSRRRISPIMQNSRFSSVNPENFSSVNNMFVKSMTPTERSYILTYPRITDEYNSGKEIQNNLRAPTYIKSPSVSYQRVDK